MASGVKLAGEDFSVKLQLSGLTEALDTALPSMRRALALDANIPGARTVPHGRRCMLNVRG